MVALRLLCRLKGGFASRLPRLSYTGTTLVGILRPPLPFDVLCELPSCHRRGRPDTMSAIVMRSAMPRYGAAVTLYVLPTWPCGYRVGGDTAKELGTRLASRGARRQRCPSAAWRKVGREQSRCRRAQYQRHHLCAVTVVGSLYTPGVARTSR